MVKWPVHYRALQHSQLFATYLVMKCWWTEDLMLLRVWQWEELDGAFCPSQEVWSSSVPRMSMVHGGLLMWEFMVSGSLVSFGKSTPFEWYFAYYVRCTNEYPCTVDKIVTVCCALVNLCPLNDSCRHLSCHALNLQYNVRTYCTWEHALLQYTVWMQFIRCCLIQRSFLCLTLRAVPLSIWNITHVHFHAS